VFISLFLVLRSSVLGFLEPLEVVDASRSQ
jgi:hypothetical protein